MKRITTIIISLLLTTAAFAQSLTIQAPDQVYVGDNFTVRFSVNEQAKDFRGPSFKGFSLISGPQHIVADKHELRQRADVTLGEHLVLLLPWQQIIASCCYYNMYAINDMINSTIIAAAHIL